MFQVLRSSAGAGKTHALVKHYLTHCLGTSDHGAYRHVLALTFTNKAAAEMKERVITYLEGLSGGGPFQGPLADVAGHLQAVAGIDGDELTRRADVVLGNMLHNWSAVSISTIDAFTRRVVKPFARDLRLDHDLRMSTEQEFYRTEAVNALIEQAGRDEATTRMLTLTCLELLQEERPWEPTRPLLDLSRELLNERSLRPLQTLRDRSFDDIAGLLERLNVNAARFRREVQRIGQEAVALFAGTSVAKEEIAYGGAALNYFQGLADFKDNWNAPGAHTIKPIAAGKLHSGKASAAGMAALESIAAAIGRLFEQAEGLREARYADHVIQRAVARELLPAYALHGIDLALEELKRVDGVTFFSDLTRRVAEVVKDEPVPYIYERLGERYRHFLIDEFQDTSLLQWNALLPLLDNALSTGGSVLLVGDAKQAIYRWRNGEVRLFLELPDLFGRDPEETTSAQMEATLRRTWRPAEALALNRRSAEGIISFNNALFDALPEVLPPALRRVYGEQAQRTWRPEPGTVRLCVAEKLTGDELNEAILEHVMESVQLAIGGGYAPGDVAVLVRSKRLGRAVAEHLQAHGFSVVSPDGLQLTADPAVQLLIECLRFTLHGDDISAARALQWQAIVACADEGTKEIPWRIAARQDGQIKVAVSLREHLHAHGDPLNNSTLPALMEGIARSFGLDPIADASLLTLLDEAHAWSSEHAQDIAGFLEHWDRGGGERSTADGEGSNAVQVMTIHKAKGLQFPVVIVPDARMTSNRSHGELFWVAPGEAVPELSEALIKESKALRDIGLPELEEEQALRDLDALNLLYVAFTRAEQQLHVLVPQGTDAVTKALLTFAESHGHLADGVVHTAPDRQRKAPAPSEVLHDVRTPGQGQPWRIRSDGEDMGTSEERRYGTAVHELLAGIRQVADIPGSVAAAVARGDLDASIAATLTEQLTTALSSAPLDRWFRASSAVRAEAAIIMADGSGLRPDRIAEDADGMHVLEIKTGRPAKAHQTQLRGYLDTLRAMGHPQVDGLLWYLSSGTTEPVGP